MANEEILSLIDAFISGTDISIKAADQLEVLLDYAFPNDDYLQETVEMLACYPPEGGQGVLGPELIRDRLSSVSGHLTGGVV